MTVGFTSVTFRQKSPAEIFALAQTQKIPAIELGCDVHLKNREDARTACRLTAETGVQVLSLGSYFRAGAQEDRNFTSLLPLAQTVGAKNIRVWAGSRASSDADEGYRSAAASQLRRIAEQAARQGIAVSVEFHQNTLNDSAKSCRALLEQAAHPNLFTYWQPLFQGEDEENLRAALPFLSHVHVFFWKNYDCRYALQAGEGDWKRWIGILKEAGFDGAYLLEFVKDDSPSQFCEDLAALRRWTHE